MQKPSFTWLLLTIPFVVSLASSVYIYSILHDQSTSLEGRLLLGALCSHASLAILLVLAGIFIRRWSRLYGLRLVPHVLTIVLVLLPTVYSQILVVNISTMTLIVEVIPGAAVVYGNLPLGVVRAVDALLYFGLIVALGLATFPNRDIRPTLS